MLAAIEREWRKDPDLRLGQLLVNLLRRNTLGKEDEGRALFAVEDGELLRWLGSETEDEERYVEHEPQKRQVGWREWIDAVHDPRRVEHDEGRLLN